MPGWLRCASAASKKRASPDDDTDLAAQLAEVTVAEVRALLAIALPFPARSSEARQAWSLWRRHKRWQSRRSYRKRTRQDMETGPPSLDKQVRLYY